MRTVIGIVLAAGLVLAACAPPAPTAAPTKPPAAPTSAPAVPTAAPKAAPTVAPTTAAKPAAPTATPAPKIKRGGTVRTSLNTDFGLAGDPHLIQLTRGDPQMHSEALVEVRMNEKTKRFELSPLLAASWEKPDPKTILFKLRQNVKFHDGSPWKADVAQWNLLRMRDHPKSLSKESVQSIQSVDIVDDYTIKVGLKAPSNSTLYFLSASLSRPMMISKAAVDKNGEDYLASHIVATGPFQLAEWRQGDRQILKRFPDYWQKGIDGQSKPYADGLEMRFIADSAVALVELRTGNSHFMVDIQPRDLPTVKGNPDLVLEERTWSSSLRILGLSQVTGPFKDNQKLRQAAQYAIDREGMVKALGQGTGRPPIAMIFEGQPGYSDKAARYTYNPDKAKQLMTEAGHPNGVDMILTVIARQPDLPQSEVVKSMLDKVGIRTTLDPIERLAWAAKIRAGNVQSTTYGVGTEADPYITLFKRMTCGGTANFASWCSPTYDACLKESEEAPNDEKRGEIFQRCINIAHEDAHYVHLWQQDEYAAYSKKLQGWGPYATVINFWADLWLE